MKKRPILFVQGIGIGLMAMTSFGCGGTVTEPAPHSDHDARHGGLLFMVADNAHHLEGVYPKPGRFELYLFDDRTRPLLADVLSASASITSGELRQPADMRFDAQCGCLAAEFSPASEGPVSIAALVRFPAVNGTSIEPQNYNFDFEASASAPDSETDASGSGN